jgi:hypothetical protein
VTANDKTHKAFVHCLKAKLCKCKMGIEEG